MGQRTEVPHIDPAALGAARPKGSVEPGSGNSSESWFGQNKERYPTSYCTTKWLIGSTNAIGKRAMLNWCPLKSLALQHAASTL